MSFQIISPKCYVRSDVDGRVLYRNPDHEVHLKKASSRDPDGARSPQPRYWNGCVHFDHRGIVEIQVLSPDDIQQQFIDLAVPTLRDARERPRPRTLKLGIYNPITDIQAKIRALPRQVRTSLVEKGFRHFVKLCSGTFQGPMIAWSHPDKIRMHFEVMALLYDTKTNKKFPWAKGLRTDGAGTTVFAEIEGKNHPPARKGFNSTIAGKMATFLREQIREIEKQMTPTQREDYELNTRLQHVILELTLHKVSQRNRIVQNHQRPDWLERLVAAWTKAPGPERIEAKIDEYLESGLVDADGMPCVIPVFAAAGVDYTTKVREASKFSGSNGPLPETRHQLLEFWIQLLIHDRKNRGYIRKKRLGAALNVFQFEGETVLFNGQTMDEIEKTPELTELLYGRENLTTEPEGVSLALERREVEFTR